MAVTRAVCASCSFLGGPQPGFRVARRPEPRSVCARHDTVVEAMRPSVPGDKLLFLMELSIEPVLAALTTQRP